MSGSTLSATPSSISSTNSTVHPWGTSTNFSAEIKAEVAKRLATPVSERRVRNAIWGAAASGVLLAGLFGAPEAGATNSTTPVYQGPERRLPSPDGGEWPVRPSTAELSPIQLVEELKAWLGLADEGAASLVGVSRRSVTNWRQGKGAYAASTGRLAQVHALVSGLIRSLGDEAQARLWLRGSDSQDRNRLALLSAGDDGLRQVVNEAASLLFATPNTPDLSAGLSDTEAARLVAAARTVSHQGPSPARRVRKPGSS